MKFLNNSLIQKDITLKFGMTTNFGPPSSKSNIELQFDVIVTSQWRFLPFRPFLQMKTPVYDFIVTSDIKICLQKGHTNQILQYQILCFQEQNNELGGFIEFLKAQVRYG